MAATAQFTIPQDALVRSIQREIEDLSLEIFTTTYGADWGAAITTAIAELPDLMAYADEWDSAACSAGNTAACPF